MRQSWRANALWLSPSNGPKMRFKLDENLPVEAADLLRRAGHDARTVLEQHLGGCADLDIASLCQEERRALVTLDVDFADIRAYPPREFLGLVVLRLRRQDKPHVLEVVQHLASLLGTQQLEGRLWIVEEARVRIRD